MHISPRGRSTVVFTIVTADYGPLARVLMNDVARHHPDARILGTFFLVHVREVREHLHDVVLAAIAMPLSAQEAGPPAAPTARAVLDGYVAEARALGAQAQDSACNPMRLAWRDLATVVHSSGPRTDSDSARCWRT